MATPTKAAKPAAKAPAKKKPAAKPPADPGVQLTPVDDGVSVTVGDAHAVVKVNGSFDLDGLIAVCKRIDRARAALS